MDIREFSIKKEVMEAYLNVHSIDSILHKIKNPKKDNLVELMLWKNLHEARDYFTREKWYHEEDTVKRDTCLQIIQDLENSVRPHDVAPYPKLSSREIHDLLYLLHENDQLIDDELSSNGEGGYTHAPYHIQ
tara:strand:- start:3508 stop:3903 length:396 start_codon:yes stop_codon:yes gene_type:complete